MNAMTLRPRSASEIADAAINLFRANGRLLLAISIPMSLPMMIMTVLFMPHSSDQSTNATMLRFVVLLAASLWSGVIAGALTYASSERYLGRDVTAREAIQAALERGFQLSLGALARWVLIFAGLVMLIVPGVYAFIFSFGMTSSIMLERHGVNAAWARSRGLARGMKSHVFGALAVAYLVFFVIFITVGYMIAGMIFGENESALMVVQDGVGMLVWPFVVCAEMLLFYDLRIRKEGFDIEHMASVLEPVTAATTQPTV